MEKVCVEIEPMTTILRRNLDARPGAYARRTNIIDPNHDQTWSPARLSKASPRCFLFLSGQRYASDRVSCYCPFRGFVRALLIAMTTSI